MRQEILTRLTTHVLTLLEQDGIKAFDRFARMGSRPLRFSTGTAYRGGNSIALWATAELKGYGSPFWLTYRQATEAGAHVRKGEKGTLILYADRWKPANAEPDAPGRLFMRAYTVFNAGQVEGLPASYYAALCCPEDWDPLPEAEAFVRATGAMVHEGGAGAWYRPSDDTITMPDRRAFADAEGYYATLLHELVHWTGADTRLKRGFAPRSKDLEGYAREELVAELGAALLCCDLKLSKAPREDHAHYLAGWMRALKEPMELWSAARAAETASDHLWGYQSSEVKRVAQSMN